MSPYRVALSSLLLAAPSFAQTPTEEAPPSQAPEVLQRVVCVGASASAGFGWNIELKTRAKLGLMLDQMIEGERAPTLDLGNAMLFQAPLRMATDQIEQALEAQPTLVVGLDFLFWFAYTPNFSRESNRAARMDRLNQGIALLDRLPGPLMVGDLPDMRAALKGVGPFGVPLLQPHMVPTEQELAELNQRLRDWAAERGDTILIPMAEFAHRSLEGEVFEVRGNRWDGKQISRLLQKDMLHPTVEGALGLSAVLLDRLETARVDLKPEHFQWDVEVARARLMEATKAERDKVLQRER
ncbi:MAG: hypothetical protein O2816_13945, partial [Planctomycetota bacterium]|nr:hypothetical protein [Planctomycetota bacterium]